MIIDKKLTDVAIIDKFCFTKNIVIPEQNRFN